MSKDLVPTKKKMGSIGTHIEKKSYFLSYTLIISVSKQFTLTVKFG